MERIRLEIKRQPFHILLGLLIIALVYHNYLTPHLLLIIAGIALAVSFYIKKTRPKTICKLLEFVERKDALQTFPGKGLIAYLLGSAIVLFLFHKQIAMASIMVLALGDSFSRLIGPFGRIKHPFNNAKFLEGVIVGIMAASLGAMLFVPPSQAITASFFTILLEGVDIKLGKFRIDDNITIPVFAGFILWAMQTFL